MKAIKTLIAKIKDLFTLRADVESLKRQIRIHQHKVDYLMSNEPRHVRRKWQRMVTNEKSPFFVGYEGGREGYGRAELDSQSKETLFV